MKIKGARLLTTEEYHRYNVLNLIKRANKGWWINANSHDYVRAVVSFNVQSEDVKVHATRRYDVRPVLLLPENSGLKLGCKFYFGGHVFTVISKEHALCDDRIGISPFRDDWQASDVNVYEKSDVKIFIDEWFEKFKNEEPEPDYFELHVTKIGLPTVRDIELRRDIIPPVLSSYWVCNDKKERQGAVAAWDARYCNPGASLVDIYTGIRPKLTLLKEDCKDFKIGDKVDFLCRRWTFIRKNEILCDECIAYGPWDNPYPYRENVVMNCCITYAGSGVERHLEAWLIKA